jgi:hypothetical protein
MGPIDRPILCCCPAPRGVPAAGCDRRGKTRPALRDVRHIVKLGHRATSSAPECRERIARQTNPCKRQRAGALHADEQHGSTHDVERRLSNGLCRNASVIRARRTARVIAVTYRDVQRRRELAINSRSMQHFRAVSAPGRATIHATRADIALRRSNGTAIARVMLSVRCATLLGWALRASRRANLHSRAWRSTSIVPSAIALLAVFKRLTAKGSPRHSARSGARRRDIDGYRIIARNERATRTLGRSRDHLP